MKHIDYTPVGVCSRGISFDIDDDKIFNLNFIGGCDGNLKAIAKLIDGMDIQSVCKILEGNTCRSKKTSCADQLVQAIKENI